MLIWQSFLLALTALLPLINPVGSALVFLGLVGPEPATVYQRLARRVAISTIGFLVAIQFLGSFLLSFFGLSLPVVQVSGGLVIAATAWQLLFEKDAHAHVDAKNREIAGCMNDDDEGLSGKIFYPFTFPVTAGPGTLVVMLTLSAHASENDLTGKLAAHVGIALAAVALSAMVYLCYAYAPKVTSAISPSSTHGMLRVIAFILLCLGVQITWKGVSLLGVSLLMHR